MFALCFPLFSYFKSVSQQVYQFGFFKNWSLSDLGQSWWIDTFKTFLGNQVENVTEHNIICTTDARAHQAEEKGSSVRHTWKQNVTQISHLVTGQRGAKVSNSSDQNFFTRLKLSAVIMNWCESLNIWIQDKRTYRVSRQDFLPLWVTEKTGHVPCLILGNEMGCALLSLKLLTPSVCSFICKVCLPSFQSFSFSQPLFWVYSSSWFPADNNSPEDSSGQRSSQSWKSTKDKLIHKETIKPFFSILWFS